MTRKSRFRSVWNRKQWLVPYLWPEPFKKILRVDQGMRHILFLFVDHFEPGHGGADPERQLERVEQWRRYYPEVVGRFQDCQGNTPRHTWFYLGEEPEHLRLLSELCFQGLGEIELHIHHGAKDKIPDHWKQSNREGLADYINKQKQFFSNYGALITGEKAPQQFFGFIHGMFALDNSLPDYCGVSGELQLLRNLGCYGDFTFPAPGKSQPPLTNRLYYPTGDPEKGRFYFKGEEVRVGATPQKKVLIFQGPLGLVRKGFKVQVEDGHLDWERRPTRNRILFWISKGIHVPGRPEWVFVKVYTHGAMERNVQELLGEPMERLHRELREACPPGSFCCLHYVSAREAFNVVMAAMAGKGGDPGQYRNYLIPPYANTLINCNRPYQLEGYTPQAWSLQLLEPKGVSLRVKGDFDTEIKADCLEEVRFGRDPLEGNIRLIARGKGRIEVNLRNMESIDPLPVSVAKEGELQIGPSATGFSLSYSGFFSQGGGLDAHFGFSR